MTGPMNRTPPEDSPLAARAQAFPTRCPACGGYNIRAAYGQDGQVSITCREPGCSRTPPTSQPSFAD